MKTSQTITVPLLCLICAGATGLYIWAWNPLRFGVYHDDGLYAVTAKALATGQGYRILSLPERPYQTKYPPLYPFLLSLIWRMFPSFPEHLWAMFLLSTLAGAGFLLLTYAYIVRRGYAVPWVALAVVATMAFNWRLLLLTTNLFSDTLYMFLSIATLWLAEDYFASGRVWRGVGVGALLGLSFLTRTVGISLLAAVTVFYLLKGHYRKLGMVLGIAALAIVPWLLWKQAHLPSAPTRMLEYYTDYVGDFRNIVMHPTMLFRVLRYNILYLIFIFIPLVTMSMSSDPDIHYLSFIILFLTPVLFITGLLRQWLSGLRLMDFYVIFYIGLLLVWPYPVFDRLLIPVQPFLLLYMIVPLQRYFRQPSTAGPAPRLRGLLFIGVMLSLFAFSLSRAVRYVSDMHKKAPQQRAAYDQEQALLGWIRAQTSPADVILAYRDPLLYLHTGRHSIRSLVPRPERAYKWEPFDEASEVAAFLRQIRETHATYLVLAQTDFSYELDPERLRGAIAKAVAQQPDYFTLVYEAPQAYARVYRIRPPAP